MKGNGPVAKAGKSVGIKFDSDRYVVNSVKSHLLLQFVLENYSERKQNEMFEYMCQQYFEEAVNLNSDNVLKELAFNVGVDGDRAAAYFTDLSKSKLLFTAIDKAKKKGVVGVPYFQIYIDDFNDSNPISFSGAQSKSGFIQTFHKLIKDFKKLKKNT